MSIETIASGSSLTDLQAQGQALYNVEANQPEGTKMGLTINLQWRFPGFENRVTDFNNLLLSAGVTPWPENGQSVALADPTNPVVYIKWVKMDPFILVVLSVLGDWLASLAAILITIGIVSVALFVVGWVFFHEVIASAIPQNPTSQVGQAVKNIWTKLEDFYQNNLAHNPIGLFTVGLAGVFVVMLVFTYYPASQEAKRTYYVKLQR